MGLCCCQPLPGKRTLRSLRRLPALEVERREKRIGASLEAAPVVHIADEDLVKAFEGEDPADRVEPYREWEKHVLTPLAEIGAEDGMRP